MKATKNGSVAALANKIATAIMTLRDGKPELATRIALKSGTWPDKEKDEGGLCFASLAEVIADALQANGYPPNTD